jgi:hypothetical protein
VRKLRVRYQYEPVLPWHIRSRQCPRWPLQEWSAYVYECYAADDTLLYVGRTRNRWQRQGAHRRNSPWYPDLDHVLLRVTACVAEASWLERHVINERRPLYNIPMREAGLRGWETRKGLKPAVHIERGHAMGRSPALMRRRQVEGEDR